jgi:Flp pilus assembly pilin Flp
MLNWLIRIHLWLFAGASRRFVGWTDRAGAVLRLGRGDDSVEAEDGQTTAEYALVILAAAAIAIVLIAWARSSGKLPAFFDKIIDDITSNAQ